MAKAAGLLCVAHDRLRVTRWQAAPFSSFCLFKQYTSKYVCIARSPTRYSQKASMVWVPYARRAQQTGVCMNPSSPSR